MKILKLIFLYAVLILLNHNSMAYSEIEKGIIYGNIELDESWAPVVYLSYIPTFEDMYLIANEIIISKSIIDSLGNFSFDIEFLPEKESLYRIHIVKQGDTPNTLIIGGKDENHLFFITNRYSTIRIDNPLSTPPFSKVSFGYSKTNKLFQKITKLTLDAEKKVEESSVTKRKFIEEQLFDKLRIIADTCSNSLVSLYAIYNSNFKSNYQENTEFYKSYLRKWKHQKNSYFEAFRRALPFQQKKLKLGFVVLIAILILIVFFIWRREKKKETGKKMLTVQERKVIELLKKGASNQEISEEYHIEISTVKSHVSSILAKMNMKSRKEIMNMK